MVRAMPGLLNVISVVGTAAMLWVGGHIILVGVDDLGWHWPYDLVHHWEEDVEHAVGGIGVRRRVAGQHLRLAGHRRRLGRSWWWA